MLVRSLWRVQWITWRFFVEYLVLPARNYGITITPHESFLAFYDFRLAHTTPMQTREEAGVNFTGYFLVILCIDVRRSSPDIMLGVDFCRSFFVCP